MGEHGVDHVVREGVLLVQECPQEDAVGSAVLHLGYLEDGRARVEHGDAGLGQGTGDDEGLAEGAASRRMPLKKAAGLKRDFLRAKYRWKLRRLYSAMSSRI